MLKIRKLADTSEGARVAGYHPETGEKHLINPATGQPEPWPLAGVQIEGETPTTCRVPTSFVDRGAAEGWITVEGQRPVVRPAGPSQGVWASSHTGQPHVFLHADALVLHCLDGDVRYKVTHQPDKYADPGDDTTPVTPGVYASGDTRVDWFYDLELES